jgi:hypothetical protein
MTEHFDYFDPCKHDAADACPHCNGLGKRLWQPRDGGGMRPAGPYRCPDCYGTGFRTAKPIWQCEFCGRFYSERTAKDHRQCLHEYERSINPNG